MRFTRKGRVRVVRTVTEHEQWSTRSGDELTASPGDLLLTDGDRVWSITPGEFELTYRPAEDGWFERTGEVDARPAVPGEVVVSMEGPAVAVSGDWVVRNDRGDEWLVPGPHFEQAYAPLPED